MRLKKEIIRARSKGPLHLATFLDLSGLELVKLEKLDKAQSLNWLIARDNNLLDDDGLEHLSQLWYLDLSNNKLTFVNQLSKFLALGTLILANNDLRWSDLERLRHAHLLSISLHGNKQLDSDPYYRIHAIDCLPLVWELDGRLVTVTERLHVKQFFIDTAYTNHPIRHKLGKTFQTTAIKNIGTDGIVSQECKYIYSKFPMSETHTKHTDERRLKYLTQMVEKDITEWSKRLEKSDPRRPDFKLVNLVKLLEERRKDVEGCNMVLLLLVTSLEFHLPTALVKAVLTTSGLNHIGTVATMPFFQLPRAHRTKVTCLLLNAAKVDRDNNVRNEGGLYPQLFMCLYHTVAQLTKISQTSQANMANIKPIKSTSDYKALMASEVVSLMLQVAKYYYYLGNDVGVINLTFAATGSMEVVYEAQAKIVDNESKMAHAHSKGVSVKTYLTQAMGRRLDRVNIKMADIPVGDRYLALSDSLPIKPLHSVIWTCQFLTKGVSIPSLEPPILNPAREAAKPKPQQAKMGETVLLGPQVVGKIQLLVEKDIALVQIDGVPVSSGGVESKLKSSDGHYTYVDLKKLCFARNIGMWRPVLTTGDKYTIHSTDKAHLDSPLPEGQSRQLSTSPEPLMYSPRTKTAMIYAKGVKQSQRPSTSIPHYQPGALMTRQVQSAAGRTGDVNTHNTGQDDHELEHLFPEENDDVLLYSGRPNSGRPDSAPFTSQALHLHDNVHHIRGLTPREESARSYTLSASSTAVGSGQQIMTGQAAAVDSGQQLTGVNDDQNLTTDLPPAETTLRTNSPTDLPLVHT